MITEDYCSYEVAKLLKEKGFLKDVDLRMTQNLSFYDNIGLHHNLNKWYDSLIQDKIDFVVAPTHQMAVKWLRKIYGIDIVIEISDPSVKDRKYYCVIWNKNNDSYILDLFSSYEECVETAIKYCLENLI